MPWESLENVPSNIKTHQGVPLTLAQANKWASIFDALEGQEGIESPAAVAWATWSKIYRKSDDGNSWVKREKSLSLSLSSSISATMVLQGNAVQSLLDKYPPVGEDKAWIVFRKRMGEDAKGWMVDELLLIDEPNDEILKDVLWEGEFMLFPVHPDIGNAIGHAIADELPDGGIGFKIESEKTISPLSTLAEAGAYILTSNGEHGHKVELDAGLNGTSDTVDEHNHEVKAGIIQSNHGHQVRKSIGGLSETECELGCHSCKGEKMFSSQPKHVKLSEEEEERIGLTELLMLSGTAIAEGLWKGTHFPADVLKEGLERVSNKRIDVEHADETWENVKGFNYKPRWNDELSGIDVSGAIFDQRVIDWFKENPDSKIGLSVRMSEDATFEEINGQKTCTYFDIKGIALTLSPACKVCWVQEAETITLSDSPGSQKSGGDETMADKTKTPEELAAEKKLADEKKLAEDKKIEEAKKLAEKKLEDEKTKKLAEDKAKEDKLNKDKEDAATAKLAAADSTLSPEIEKRFSDMQTELDSLKQANKTLSNERSLSDANTLVNGMIKSGQLSEAKRESTTQVLMALSDDKDRAAFLNTIGGNQSWIADEKGLTLSEEKDEDKDKGKEDLTFSDEDRGIIT